MWHKGWWIGSYCCFIRLSLLCSYFLFPLFCCSNMSLFHRLQHPSGHIHLLQHGVLHGLRGKFFALEHRGKTDIWSTSSPFSCSDLGLWRVVSHTFFPHSSLLGSENKLLPLAVIDILTYGNSNVIVNIQGTEQCRMQKVLLEDTWMIKFRSLLEEGWRRYPTAT